MNALNAAKHYEKVLRNVAEKMAMDEEDEQDLKEMITRYDADQLASRYGNCPKIIFEIGGIDVGAFELRTDFGWMSLSEYGLKEEAAKHCEPYNASVLCFYE